MLQTSTPKLDPREQHYWTALPQRGLNLFLRHLAPAERRGRPRIVTVPDQWARFIEDVPASEAPVLDRAHFADWGERYLDCDAEARRRDPPGVKIPTGPFADILAAWHGELAYDPGAVRAPVAIQTAIAIHIMPRAPVCSAEKSAASDSRAVASEYMPSGNTMLHSSGV